VRIYSIAIPMLASLLPTTLLYGEDQGAPKNELAFGLGGLTSISRAQHRTVWTLDLVSDYKSTTAGES
jgi:hypothetical protein